jgi:hypothetical protein
MKTPSYFERGAYPYESALGILINVASIYDCSPFEAFKVMSGKRFKFPDDILYEAKYLELIPKNKLHARVFHIPSTFRIDRFESKRIKIRFCRECMQIGYHSVFFCLPQVNICLVHGRELEELCTNCYKNISTGRASIAACGECGFYLGRALEQLPFRADHELYYRLYKAGLAQHKWFDFITSKACNDESFFRFLDSIDSYQATPSLAALTVRFKLFPYAASENSSLHNSLRCLHWKFPNEEDSELQWFASCDNLLQKQLKYHDDCLHSLDSYLRYWSGKAETVETCLLSIVYFLVRLRLSSLSFKQGHASRLGLLSFDYVRVLERSFAGARFIPSELVRVYFLKLIFHIHFYLRAGYSVRIAMQPWKGVFYDLVSRSMKNSSIGETYFCIVPLYQRSCMTSLSGDCGIAIDECQFSRLGDSYYIIKQESANAEDTVDVFI